MPCMTSREVRADLYCEKDDGDRAGFQGFSIERPDVHESIHNTDDGQEVQEHLDAWRLERVQRLLQATSSREIS